MNDICDRASSLEQHQRDLAIENARKPQNQTELVLDGDTVICACCGVPIPQERLRVEPNATLCVECKTLMERRSGTVA